jgi:predicted ester cyclase
VMYEDETRRGVMRSIHVALINKDVDKAVSFYRDDATLVANEGTFKGIQEIRRYYSWLLQQWPELKFIERMLLVDGNKAACEYVVEGTGREGMGSKFSGVHMYEFRNGKVQQVRAYSDRLLIAKQLARGWLAKRLVSSIVDRMQRGLH